MATRTVTPGRAKRSVATVQLDAIKAVSAAVAQGAALGDTLDQIAETAQDLVSAQAAAIVLRNRDVDTGLVVAGSHGLSTKYVDHLNRTHPLEVGKGPSGVAAQTGRPVAIDDVFVDERIKPWRDLAVREHYRAMVSVPLRLGADRVIGVLNAYRAAPVKWTAREIALVSLLADHAAIAIRTANLLDDARRQVDGLSLMVRSLRAQAHEHANRMHAIYGMLVLGEVEEARRLVAALEDGYHSVYGTVTGRVENAAVAGLLIAEAAIARESGIDVTLDRRSRLGELPAGMTDLDAVTILGNLLHNAVEAASTMPPSRRRVRVLLRQRAGETLFRVRDWGPGIPAARRATLFDRDVSSKPGHPGLGLHLVRNVAQRTGGDIAVEPARPSGVVISVTYAR